MKKIIGLIFSLLLLLVGCAPTQTIYEEKTIIVNIESDVSPKFAANFGEGSYNENTKVYTHKIDYIKDLYIYITFEGYKTQTLYIPTIEMSNDIIEKTITFNTMLDAEIEFNIDNIDSLEGLKVISPANYTDLIIKSKNKFSIVVPSREKDYEIKFELPNYKEFKKDVKSDELVSGMMRIEIPAIKVDQVYIGFKPSDYNYSIYSYATNEVVASAYMSSYDNEGKIKYHILSNNTAYYVRLNIYGKGVEKVLKVDQNENFVFENNSQNVPSSLIGYVYVTDTVSNYMLHDKTTNMVTGVNELFHSLDKYGVIILKDNEYYYCNDISKILNKEKSNDSYYYLKDDMEFFEKVTVKLKTINPINNSTNEKVLTDESVYDASATIENGIITLTSYQFEEGEINCNLYDKNGNYITSLKRYIHPRFDGEVVEGAINVEGKNVIYKFPLLPEDLVYENDEYKDVNITLTNEKNLVSILLTIKEKESQMIQISETDNAHLKDDNFNIVVPQYFDGIAFFEVVANTKYTLTFGEDTREVYVTQEDINNGMLFLFEDDTQLVKLKIPEGYDVQISGLANMDMFPRKNGIITFPAKESIYGFLSNGYAQRDFYFALDGRDLYKLEPFLVMNRPFLQMNEARVITNNQYIYYYDSSKDTYDFQIRSYYIQFVYDEIGQMYTEDNYQIPFNKFKYDENLKGYYCDFEPLFSKVVVIKEFYSSIYLSNYIKINYDGPYDGCYYMSGTTYAFYNGVKYDLSKYESKYLILSIAPGGQTINIEESNEFIY